MNSGLGMRPKRRTGNRGDPGVRGWGCGVRGLASPGADQDLAGRGPRSMLGKRAMSLLGFCVFSLELFLYPCTCSLLTLNRTLKPASFI